MIRRDESGFTLIELLVVITIIVVLVSLLMPAMDKAIYQAELAVCAAQLKGIGSGVTVYASDFRRRYPHRAGMSKKSWAPEHLRKPARVATQGANQGPQQTYDDRPAMQGYIPFDLLVDPLVPRPIELDPALTHPESWISATVDLWFGYRYNGHAGMLRLGDRVTWSDARDSEDRSFLGRFAALATDHLRHVRGAVAVSSHQNAQDTFIPTVVQDEPNAASGVILGDPDARFTWSGWFTVSGEKHPPIADMNHAFADVSIDRFRSVLWNDPRMARVPSWSDALEWEVGAYTLIPAQ